MTRSKRRRKRIVIIAGPNGAGKTTFATEFLPKESGFPDFINADLIAQGISPFAPAKAAMQAGKIMLGEMERRVRVGESFAFETTLAGLNYARHIPRWRQCGYHVKLNFLVLPTSDMAVARVKMRVKQGGHHVADEVVRRRFAAGRRNFETVYRALVDAWDLYDNSGPVPRLLASGRNR